MKWHFIKYSILLYGLFIFALHPSLSQEISKDTSNAFPNVSWFEELDKYPNSVDSVDLFNQLIRAAQKESKDYDYLEALEYYTEALHFQSGINKSLSYYKTKTKLAELYIDLGYFAEAKQHLTDAIKFFKKNKELPELARAISLMVKCNFIDEAPDLARNNILEVIRLNKKIKSPTIRISNLINQGIYLGETGDRYTAIKRLNQAIKISRLIGHAKYYVQANLTLGNTYFEIARYKDAVKVLLKALKIAEMHNNDYAKRDIYRALSKNLNALEKYNSALLYLEQYTKINDRILNKQHQTILNKLIVKYESKQKAKEIISLENQKMVSQIKHRRSNLSKYALFFALIAVLITAFFIILYYQQRLASNQIIIQQKEQINHQKIVELNNNQQIISMESMMKGQELERNRIAKDLHDSLGGLLSTIKLQFDGLQKNDKGQLGDQDIQHIHNMLDMACNEVRNIASNLKPGALDKLGLSNAILDLITKYKQVTETEIVYQEYGLKTSIPSAKSIHIYRIVQELLHNSIKHANASEILVQLSEDNGDLNILIEDDGRGFDLNKIKEGMGTQNIRSRINYLKADINTQSQPGEGTSTMIIFPLNNLNDLS